MGTRRSTTWATTRRPKTTTRRPTTTTTTTQKPVTTPRREFPRRIAIEQIPVHEYQYEQEDYDLHNVDYDLHNVDYDLHYPDEDEDARHHVVPEYEYDAYPDYSPAPATCPSSLAECVSSCAPVLAIQQRAHKLCVNECLERCS